MAVVNYQDKWVYLMEPHTASRAVHEALIQDPNCEYAGTHHASLQDIGVEKLLGFDVICTVRNPLDTVVSRWRLGKGNKTPFAEWIRTGEIESKWSGLWRSCNIVCWFENLQLDLNHVFQRRVPLVHDRKHKTLDKHDWSTYYNEETFEFVTARFKEYIEAFGYQLVLVNGRVHAKVDREVRKRRVRVIGYGRL